MFTYCLTMICLLVTSVSFKIQCFVIDAGFVLCLYLQRLWSMDQINVTGAYDWN